MKFQDHCLECERELGKAWEVVHRWLDEFAKHYHDPITKHYHWLHRHHTDGVEEVRHKWGDQAERAAELHIISDMGEVLSYSQLQEKLHVELCTTLKDTKRPDTNIDNHE